MAEIPTGYRQLAGSERKLRKGATRIGPADPAEPLLLSIYVRRRADAPALPKADYYATTPLGRREVLSRADLAARQGASPADLRVVSDFAEASGLKRSST